MMRLRLVLPFLVVGLAGGLCAVAAEPAATGPATAPATQPATEVLMLQVLRPLGPGRELKERIFNSETVSFGDTSSGVKIVLQVPMPADVVDFPKTISLSTFTDDKGTYLGFGERHVVDRMQVRGDPPVAMMADRSRCIVKVYSERLPDPGATELHLKGKFVVRVGRGEKQFTQHGLLFRLGRTIEAGPVKLTITNLSEPYRGQPLDGLNVTFAADESLVQLKKLAFSDSEGKPVEFAEQSRGNAADNPGGQASLSALLTRRPGSAEVSITCYEKVETVEIPIDLKVKVGL